MNNHDLRAILSRIQDHLSEDDRKRLNFVLGQDHSIQSSGDSDKANEKNMNRLIKLFEEIHCDEAVKLLKEHIHPTQLTPTPNDEKRVMHARLTDHKHVCDSNNTLINSNNTNINPVTIVLNNRSKRRQFFKLSSMMTEKCLLLFIILSIILTVLVVISLKKMTRLKIHNDNKINEKTKILELKLNETIQQLNRIELLHKQSQFTEGNVCGCPQWCNDRDSPYGACGDGHICICRNTPIEKGSLGDACTCDSWCRERGYKNGGICGDGYTCICSKEDTLIN